MAQTSWVVAWLVAGIVVAFAGAWLGRRWWLKRARVALVTLVARAESVRSGLESLRGFLERLADADEQTWMAFASDPQDDERRTLTEVCYRMDVVSRELAEGPLQKVAHPVSDTLPGIAVKVHDWTTRLGETKTVEEVVDIIMGGIDLKDLLESFDGAHEDLERLLETFGVKDSSVYGGGLYI
jgi:hypothetical protein